ncbi:FAD-binding domain-containing protein [Aspergillus indologenus CBS 114.80]|uniref:FAD-binding domain-containing protein n=1 Tax=Aspergillus indologenus CBS 114.80 TaxID=1450541 RepID=A0A2V5IM41_9EURO|nr:FAD-binding domain-containing protein [Aspergillus indologenus CBS 114.80]
MFRTIWPWIGLLSATYAAPQAPIDFATLLANKTNLWSHGTVVSFPENAYFENATERWTTWAAPSYFAAVSPATEQDVVTAIKLATSSNISFLTTGGRHGFTVTLGELDQGLAIDLGQLDSYHIDSTAETVTIGGSTTIGDLLEPLAAAGFMIQSGSGSCPGYVGLTVGAGVGRYMGYFGLVMDGLLSARMVTADGRLVEVSATKNPDLFWGLRGAGANLGVITSATYKLHRMSDHNDGMIMNADFIFPLNHTEAYFRYLATWSGRMPAHVAAITLVNYNTTTQEPQVHANWIYIGPEAEARQFLAPILALHPASSTLTYVPWNKLLATAGGAGFNDALCQKGANRNFYTVNLRKLTAATFQDTFDQMAAFYAGYPDAPSTYINIETFPNQATVAVPDHATAYPWRDAIGFIQVGIIPDEGASAATQQAGDALALRLRQSWVQTSGYPDLAIYVNYAHGDETLEQIYGRTKLPRLAKLKKQWDPTNVFGYNNGLPTSYRGTKP